MDNRAIYIVEEYIRARFSATHSEFDVYIVWKCKTLQNWKWMISSSLEDGMYYEVTYNGDKKEFYLDAYKKKENICIKEENT